MTSAATTTVTSEIATPRALHRIELHPLLLTSSRDQGGDDASKVPELEGQGMRAAHAAIAKVRMCRTPEG
jgi:hypothetical protein